MTLLNECLCLGINFPFDCPHTSTVLPHRLTFSQWVQCPQSPSMSLLNECLCLGIYFTLDCPHTSTVLPHRLTFLQWVQCPQLPTEYDPTQRMSTVLSMTEWVWPYSMIAFVFVFMWMNFSFDCPHTSTALPHRMTFSQWVQCPQWPSEYDPNQRVPLSFWELPLALLCIGIYMNEFSIWLPPYTDCPPSPTDIFSVFTD